MAQTRYMFILKEKRKLLVFTRCPSLGRSKKLRENISWYRTSCNKRRQRNPLLITIKMRQKWSNTLALNTFYPEYWLTYKHYFSSSLRKGLADVPFTWQGNKNETLRNHQTEKSYLMKYKNKKCMKQKTLQLFSKFSSPPKKNHILITKKIITSRSVKRWSFIMTPSLLLPLFKSIMLIYSLHIFTALSI